MFSAFHVFTFSFISPGNHCEHLAWGRENAGICFSCICLFILYALLSVFFSSSWCQVLTVGCDFNTPWTFPLTFFIISISHLPTYLRVK